MATALIAHCLETESFLISDKKRAWFAPLQQFEDEEGNINLSLSAVLGNTVVQVSPDAVKATVPERRVKNLIFAKQVDADTDKKFGLSEDSRFESSEDAESNEDCP